VQNLLCGPVLHSAILAALLQGTGAVCISETLWRSTEGAISIWQGSYDVGHQRTF